MRAKDTALVDRGQHEHSDCSAATKYQYATSCNALCSDIRWWWPELDLSHADLRLPQNWNHQVMFLCKYHLKCTSPLPPSHPFTSLSFSVALTPGSCPCLVLWHSRTFCGGEKGISCHISMLTLPFTLGHRWCPGRSTYACTKCIHIDWYANAFTLSRKTCRYFERCDNSCWNQHRCGCYATVFLCKMYLILHNEYLRLHFDVIESTQMCTCRLTHTDAHYGSVLLLHREHNCYAMIHKSLQYFLHCKTYNVAHAIRQNLCTSKELT